jgi:hypothetical protein
MIKPSDIQQKSTKPQADRRRLEIEAHFDAAILAAQDSGSWPAKPPTTRSGWRDGEIEDVVVKYRQAGWSVKQGSRGVMVEIDLPGRVQQ